MGSFRNSASFGKRQEYRVFAELLRRGFDVYQTMVDDQGIDCVVRLAPGCYVDIQIKARSKGVKSPRGFQVGHMEPRADYWYIFYAEIDNCFWVMPSADVARLGNQQKGGKNQGIRTLVFPKTQKAPRMADLETFAGDEGFRRLAEAAKSRPGSGEVRLLSA